MIVQGSWFIGNFRDDDETVDVVYFPYPEEGNAPPHTMIHGLGNGCFYISSDSYTDSVKQEASIKLLRMLTSKETAAVFAKQTGMLSSVDIREFKIDYNRLTRRGQLLINNGRQFIGPPDSFVDRTVWNEVISEACPMCSSENGRLIIFGIKRFRPGYCHAEPDESLAHSAALYYPMLLAGKLSQRIASNAIFTKCLLALRILFTMRPGTQFAQDGSIPQASAEGILHRRLPKGERVN